MSNSRSSRFFMVARLFVACATLLLLSATVMQREDRDGYQATHLFFMPRENWEMDEGRGMLHEGDYYGEIDREELAQEILRQEEVSSVSISEDGEHEIEVAQAPESPGESTHHHFATVRRAPYSPSLTDNQLPVASSQATQPPGLSHALAAPEAAVYVTDWRGDVPSPPPRFPQI